MKSKVPIQKGAIKSPEKTYRQQSYQDKVNQAVREAKERDRMRHMEIIEGK